jgi:hypothetical protein
VTRAGRLYYDAKKRARRSGVPFNLEMDDIQIPGLCPVLGIPLIHGTAVCSPNSPSLDRIVPSLGYTKGNVIIVSMLANMIKTNATPGQIIAVGEFYKKLLTQPNN